MNFRVRKYRLNSVVSNAALVIVCLAAQGVLAQNSSSGSAADVPSQEEQNSMLAAMQHYAEQYISHLPNFICAQVTQQFEAGRKPTHWHRGDTLQFKLVFNKRGEERSLETVNGRPPTPSRRWRTPLTTEGEFGTLLDCVFGTSSGASFHWSGWAGVGERRLAVFDYAVDGEHSTMKIGDSDLAHAIVAYHGSVYGDPGTGEVWRISDSLSDIPAEIHTKSMSRSVEYGQVPIGGIKYLLPIRASVLLDTGRSNIRNEMWFHEYRKFETDSSVTYTSDGQATEPAKLNPPQ